MSRDDNIAVFKDTERLCKLDSKIKDSVKSQFLPRNLFLKRMSFRKQTLISMKIKQK